MSPTLAPACRTAVFDLDRARASLADTTIALTRRQSALLYWLPRVASLESLADRLAVDLEATEAELQELARLGLVEAGAWPAASCGDDGFARIWQDLPERYGERPVIVWDDDGSTLNAEEVGLLARVFARLVASKGGKGVVVGVCALPRPESLIAIWGTWLAGGVVVAVDPSRGADFVGAVLRQAMPAIVLLQDASLASTDLPAALLVEDFAATLAAFLDAPDTPVANEDDQAGAILFTSGSSGAPKGVVLSRGGLWRSGATLAAAYGWNRDDALLCTAGLYSMSGLRNPCVAALCAGTSIVLDSGAAHARTLSVAAACERRAVTILSTVPAMLKLLAAGHADRLPRLRMVLSTGSSLQGASAEQATAALGVPVYDYYGMTETSGVCVLVTPSMHPVAAGVIGRPEGCLAHVLKADGSLAPDGEEGELAILGENLMLGYLNEAAATQAILRDGWLHTGDIVLREANGNLVLRGRRDERVKTRDGDVLYPVEVESVLRRHPDVADACVRPKRGQLDELELCAFVVARQGTSTAGLELALRQAVIDALGARRQLARVIFLAALSRSDNGKVIDQLLREATHRD